jgi:hypothetical protein
MFRSILVVIAMCVIFLAAFALQNRGPAAMRFYSA